MTPATPGGGWVRPVVPARPAELLLAGQYRLDLDGQIHGPGSSSHELAVGDRLELPGATLRSIGPTTGPVCLLITPTAGAPVLWAPRLGSAPTDLLTALAQHLATALTPDPATDPATDPAADLLASRPLGAAILGPGDSGTPDGCAWALARLRAGGVVIGSTQVLLVGLGHRQGPPERLARCLDHWGAQAPADGTPIPALDRPSGPAEPTWSGPGIGRTLVLGGSGSGKSALAEQLIAAEPEVLYTATGPVVDLRTSRDSEWERRVRRHRERRPAWWRTEETDQVAALLAKVDQPILLDSVGTWLTGVLDRAGAWHDQDGWQERVSVQNEALVHAWRNRRARLVAVSDEVGLGVVPATPAGRLFRDHLGQLNQRLADESDQVLVVVAGQVLTAG